jgi:propanol-preferring alcohol dehydrogenase
MSDIPSFPYRLLWGERGVVSVANLTREDGRDFMRLAATLQLDPSVEVMPLTAANDALARLRAGKLEGAAVLVPEEGTDGDDTTGEGSISAENKSVPF